MYPISVYFGMFIRFQTTITLITLRLTIKPAAEGPGEGSDADLFIFLESVNTKENPSLFVTTPATNIP